MKYSKFLILLSFSTILLFTQCKPDKCSTDDTDSVRGCMDNAALNFNADAECEDNSCEYIELSQKDLDEATTLIKSVTGPQNGLDFPHNGTMNSSETTTRDIFSKSGSVPSDIVPGTLITKHTYANDSLGNKTDQLLVTFAMLKHEAGYWEASNDWEYFSFPNNDPSVDFTANPNGVLANAAVSGNVFVENPTCVRCHNIANDGDQLFSND